MNFYNESGVCTNGTAPSVSSINRILRNRAAERAAAEFARNYQLAAAATAASVHYPLTPHPHHHSAHPSLPYPGKRDLRENKEADWSDPVVGGNPGHQLYAAWAAAAAAAALASHQGGQAHPQSGHFWPGGPLAHAALLQQHHNREDLENRDRDRGEWLECKLWSYLVKQWHEVCVKSFRR